MAEADRQRLLERALALPNASPADFAGGRRPPHGAHPDHLKRINDTALRTKLVETHIAEGLQSPKGPQKIASIVRIYPSFDAPPRSTNGRKAVRAAATRTSSAGASPRRGLPSVEEMERVLARIRELECEVAGELALQVDERIATLKRTLAESTGDELERVHRELGAALAERRELAARVRGEAFRRLETDTGFSGRVHLRFLDRG